MSGVLILLRSTLRGCGGQDCIASSGLFCIASEGLDLLTVDRAGRRWEPAGIFYHFVHTRFFI